jgi:hypothetical protein
VEILDKADQDDEQGAGDSNEEQPDKEGHAGLGQGDHTGILTQRWEGKEG